MRKKKKEIKDFKEIEAILRKASVCRLAMVDDGEPYIVPLNFAHEDGRLYFHSAVEGRKIDVLRRSPRVCFEAETDVRVAPAPMPCGWTTKFNCVIGWGTATIIENPAEKRRGLNVLMRHYDGTTDDFPEDALAKTAVIVVEIESMTGKRS